MEPEKSTVPLALPANATPQRGLSVPVRVSGLLLPLFRRPRSQVTDPFLARVSPPGLQVPCG